jgi:hypothetical protein
VRIHVPDEAKEQAEDLRLDRDRRAAAAQFAPTGVAHNIAKRNCRQFFPTRAAASIPSFYQN